MKPFFRHLLLVTLVFATAQRVASAEVSSDHYESRLLGATTQFISGDWPGALASLDTLLEDYPASRIAHLLRSDLLWALAGRTVPLSGLGTASPTSHVQSLTEQWRLRWQHAHPQGEVANQRVPAKLLRVGADRSAVLYVDLPAARLYVFGQGHDELQKLADYYVSVGRRGYGKQREGDLKTPVGIYRIDGYIPGVQLDARYGFGALTTDYPNALDQRLQRTGSGIWLHGTEPGWINRAPRASEGCITLSNNDFAHLHRILGTTKQVPIIIDDSPEWVFVPTLKARRDSLIAAVHASTRDNAAATATTSNPARALAWQQASGEREFIEVFVYPGHKRQLLTRAIEFEDLGKALAVEQYWRQDENGQWRIMLQQQLPLPSQRKIASESLAIWQKRSPGA